MHYLSWTQLNTIETNEQDYIDYYILRKPRPTNVYMELGKKLSDALEVDELTGEPMLDLAIAQIPQLEVSEMELTTELNGENGIIPLMAQLDSCSKDLTAFKEYKTAIKRWNQKRADDSGQITFYSTVIWLKTKKIPKDIELIGVQTAWEDDKIVATGEVYSIKTQRTITDIVGMIGRVERAWQRISELKKEYEKSL